MPTSEEFLREIESQDNASKQQIGALNTMIKATQLDVRKLQLTLGALTDLDANSQVYEGVGKMFIALPVSELQSKLKAQEDDKTNQMRKYLELKNKGNK